MIRRAIRHFRTFEARNPLRCWADTRSFSSWTTLSFTASATFNYGMNLLLASIQGPAAAGVMSATRQMIVLVRSVRSTRTYMVVLVLRQSREMFVARACGAVAALGGAALLVPTYNIAGALASLALGRLVNLVTVHHLARRVTRAARHEERTAQDAVDPTSKS